MNWKTTRDKEEANSQKKSAYHLPVLLHECMEALQIRPEGVYVDATFGGGGHSLGILKHLSAKGKLVAFDQDETVQKNLPNDERLIFIPQNFRYLQRFLRAEGITEVDGILADLGVSSYQFDTAERGFSFRFDGALDMRMKVHSHFTAAHILNTASAERLQKIFSEYGEVRNAKTLSEKMVEARLQKPFKTIQDLLTVCEPLIRGERHRYLAQVFQSLRIEVNDELEALKDLLQQSAQVLKSRGVLAVITFHSLEDRLVKNFMRTGNFEGVHQKDDYGNIKRVFEVKTKKPIQPTAEEVKKNSRARSAKLRVAIKI
jgi:16S rRNA (cytosine1402-N4)-methyltransferase